MTVTLRKCTRPTCALLVSTLRKCIIVFVSVYLTHASALAALAQLVLYLGLKVTVFLAEMEVNSWILLETEGVQNSK